MLPPNVKIRLAERPELSETFADSLGVSTFDGMTVRLELCVTRLDLPQKEKEPSASRSPACRLVLSPDVAVELYNVLQGMVAAMEKKGLIKKREQPKPQS